MRVRYLRFETDTETRNRDQAMEIGGTTFGTITIDGKTYEHDVIIRLSGEVVKRKKKLSKKYYGTSHVLSKDEAEFVFESGAGFPAPVAAKSSAMPTRVSGRMIIMALRTDGHQR